MRPIDRVIVEVNNKVYSFLNPVFWDETEHTYSESVPALVNKLSITFPMDNNFLKDLIDRSNKTFRQIRRSKVILVVQGIPVESFIIYGVEYDGRLMAIKMSCPY